MIRQTWTYLRLLLICIACILVLSACSKDEAEDVRETPKPMLRIYVYDPENPINIRGNVGDVTQLNQQESKITNLQIWVFESATGDIVGYLNPSQLEIPTPLGRVYMMAVSDEFAANKPDVDVYVAANIKEANCGISFDENTTREELQEALLENGISKGKSDYFGLNSLTMSVPDEGLPMTGLIKNQPIYGESPVLRVGDGESISTVKLVRAVSRLRFVFSRSNENDTPVRINNIVLSSGRIPTQEYLFLEDAYDNTKRNCHIVPYYEIGVTSLLSSPFADIAGNSDPRDYAYTDQTAQKYENLIASGITNNELTAHGPIYFRESDRILTGAVTYKVGDEAEKFVNFVMQEAGDFARNHTWIVYGYFSSGDKLEIVNVFVKSWNEEIVSHEFYNW